MADSTSPFAELSLETTDNLSIDLTIATQPPVVYDGCMPLTSKDRQVNRKSHA